MAYRTTESEVRGILLRISPNITNFEPYIKAANSVVTQHCSDLDNATAAIVETWLAAHFLVMNDERIDSEGVRGISRSFQFKIDLGLNQSKYGQQALLLDYSGGLAQWQKDVVDGKTSRTGTINWLGKEVTSTTTEV